MVRKSADMAREVRESMRGGPGQAVITTLFAASEMTCSARMCAKITLEQGCGIGLHEHKTEDEVYYILSGTGRVAEGDGTQTDVFAGDAVLTGNGQSHSIVNTGAEPLELLAVVVTY